MRQRMIWHAYSPKGQDDGWRLKENTVEREVRLNDKMKALELLGKHLGMFKDKLEVDADMDLNITIDYGEDDTG